MRGGYKEGRIVNGSVETTVNVSEAEVNVSETETEVEDGVGGRRTGWLEDETEVVSEVSRNRKLQKPRKKM